MTKYKNTYALINNNTSLMPVMIALIKTLRVYILNINKFHCFKRKFFSVAFYILLYFGLTIDLNGCSRRTTPTTLRAEDFVDSLGICVHFNNSNADQMISALRMLGASRIRTDPPNLALINHSSPFEMVARAGIHATYFITGGLQEPAASDHSQLGALKSLAERFPGSIEFVEGPNEVNNWPVRYDGFKDTRGHALPGGRRGAQNFQNDLYKFVKSDPDLGAIPVIAYTDIDRSLGRADFLNVHLYPRQTPIDGLAERERWWHGLFAGGRPIVSTEWGYPTPTPLGAHGVTLNQQSLWILTAWAELARIGFAHTFIYELHDDGVTPSDPEDHYGLFTADWSPKPAAVALAKLIQIVRDPSPSATRFRPLPFDGHVEGAKALDLVRADGSRVLLLWSSANPAPSNVTIRLAKERTLTLVDLDKGPTQLGRQSVFRAPYKPGLLILELSAN